MSHGIKNAEYQLDTGTDLGHKQMDYLQQLLDPVTTGFLDEIGIKPGQRSLDLGAGGGSITRWLAERTGPGGQVVAVDLETRHLTEEPGVEVHQHDINDGLPVDGPFDLIHARLVLMHLARREEILAMLVDALAPGGWLVLHEASDPKQYVVSAPSSADADLFHHVLGTGLAMVARAGIRFEWAHEVPGHLAGVGLTDIRAQEFSTTVDGGTGGCLLYSNYIRQVEGRLRDEGITDEELSRFHDLMRDPRCRVWTYRFVQTRGRRPR